MMYPFMKVCKDMQTLITRLIIDGIKFNMWTKALDGNIGVAIYNSNGEYVAVVSQYLNLAEKMSDGHYRYEPIGLGYWFVDDDEYVDDHFTEELYDRLITCAKG